QDNQGLKSVALDQKQELELAQDIKSFINDQEFYASIGQPYRRGYLFHGRPGTGKTSLINAIAAELERDIYFLNLRQISNDSQLQSIFSQVRRGQIIVMEDIDAMSKVLDDDDMEPLSPFMTGGGIGKRLSSFTLSTLLGCLDGHTMQPGNIVIMTTNHPEVLDPALIRPGRIDLSFELGCVTRYQVRRIYENIVLHKDNDPTSEAKPINEKWLATFPEGVVPPCEMMRIMLLHR
ncbi:MAG: P-loop containing nucleoside triphosphate hydrolase protein, partial [Piptocephalis tieghemiana]